MNRRDRRSAWLLFSLVAIFVALPTGYVVSRALLEIQVGAAGMSIEQHRLGLAVAMVAFGATGAAGILVLYRALVGPIRAGKLASALIPASTAGIAGCIGELAIVGWGIERFGEQGADPDLLREATFVPVLTVVTGLAGSMRVLSPDGRPRRLTTLLTATTAGVVLALVLLNLPGMFDGIGPAGMELGIGLAVMATVVGWIAVAALRSPESQDPERTTSPTPGS